jgi:hypothetical protein
MLPKYRREIDIENSADNVRPANRLVAFAR